MECPVCKRTHPNTFEAKCFGEFDYMTRVLTRLVEVIVCKHCGIVFMPLTESDRSFWMKRVGTNEKDQTPML